MSEKSVWQGFGKLVGGWGKSSAKPLATSTRRCEAGHPMAADWIDCPYCKAARQSGEKTRVSIDDVPPPSVAPVAADPTRDPAPADRAQGAAQPRRETLIDRLAAPGGSAGGSYAPASHAAGGGGRRETRVFGGDAAAAEAPRRSGPGRRLTGIVVSFTWSPLGRLYTVYEGRNFCGSGTVSAEGDRDCDVLIHEDGAMSSTHFLVLCQGGKYRISDCNSTNGTYVDGELVDSLGIELADGAQIYAGATLLTFKKLVPPSAAAVAQAAAAAPQPVPAARPPHPADRPPRGPGGVKDEDDEDRSI